MTPLRQRMLDELQHRNRSAEIRISTVLGSSFFSRSRENLTVLSRVFRGKFVTRLRRLFARGQLRFFGECIPLHEEKASPVSFANFIGKTRLSMPGRLSAAPSTCCTIWLATRIVSPFPTIGCFPSLLPRSIFAGRTMLTAVNSAP